MKIGVLLVIAAVLTACVSNSMQKQASINMVGLWEEDSPTVHAITLRKADGTYRAKLVGIYDYAKPAVTYESAGHWELNGRECISTLDYISTPMLRRDIGKQWRENILASNKDLLRYFSTDGAVVEERRIGEASDSEFEKAPLKPLANTQ